MSTLAIYTSSYPYGEAETFLEHEIRFLATNFREIYIIPFSKAGVCRIVPENVIILPPVREKKWSDLRVYFTGILHFSKIFKIPELSRELVNYPFLKCLKYLGYGIITKKKLSRIISFNAVVHYSYWLGFSTFALTLLKQEGKIKTIVSRTHGYDLYEERGEKSLAFIRAATIKHIDKLFFISDHGLNYMREKLPDFSLKYCLARLGTPDPGYTNPEPDRNCITIVSCSAINVNKRIDLILESLIILKTKYPSLTVNWHHLGGGRDITTFVERAKYNFFNTSVNCLFHGNLTNSEVFRFYMTVSVDLLINVSKYEGIPVSVMEAQSFSIPVVVTNVGGTAEIVNDQNGVLLHPDFSPDDLAELIHNIYKGKELWRKKRLISRIFWEDHYDASKNYPAFVNMLIKLSEDK